MVGVLAPHCLSELNIFFHVILFSLVSVVLIKLSFSEKEMFIGVVLGHSDSLIGYQPIWMLILHSPPCYLSTQLYQWYQHQNYLPQ